MSIKNVILVGVSGSLGPAILNAFIASGKFNLTILSRESSIATYPAQVKVVKVDYGSQAALVNAMKGQDAAVVSLGINSEDQVKIHDAVVDAAIEAGVSHIIPSSYTADISKPPGSLEPVFGPKVKSLARLQKQAEEGKIKVTPITNGAFFDWGLIVVPFLGIDLPNKRAVLIDGGRAKIHHTLLSTIGDAAVAILSNPAVAVNRPALIHDFFVSQRDILEIAEEELGSKFEIIDVDSEELYRTSREKLAAGDFIGAAGVIQASVWGTKKPSSSTWDPEDDTKALGLSQKDLRAEVVKIIDQLKLKK
ncbi:hypothetical protein C8J56DRAFT_836047 [Mycena floridula]|nr:hypothetical protein C8J56DRAFT_836047 [Mycena floridula]